MNSTYMLVGNLNPFIRGNLNHGTVHSSTDEINIYYFITIYFTGHFTGATSIQVIAYSSIKKIYFTLFCL